MEKPFSQACENNKTPILAVLRRVFATTRSVLEIGTGTGQHAVYFAEQLPHLTWYPTDRKENISGINCWLQDAALPNLKPVTPLDVNDSAWQVPQVDGAFSANTVHIMAWPEVELMFRRLAPLIQAGGHFCLYGPFKYQGKFTTSSNERFDGWLKSQAAHRGVRDIEKIQDLALANDLKLVEDNAMPANNQLLVFLKQTS